MLFIAACWAYYAGRAPFFGQWDSFDYLRQAVTHKLSALAFGRPVFAAWNIALWETAHKLFKLDPRQIDSVLIPAIILSGAAGLLVFHRFARHLFPPVPARMAALALLASPMYALYSGFVMTEVPMLLLILLAAILLWESGKSAPDIKSAAGGVLFGAAVGVREQALTLAVGLLWILWVRRSDFKSRLRGWSIFGMTALMAIALPVAALYVADPAWFFQRTRLWLDAIPTDHVHFWRNLQATILYTFIMCPASWLLLAGAGWQRSRRRRGIVAGNYQAGCARELDIPGLFWGVLGFIVLPLAVLLRDADVQMHPRYTLVALPGIVILCILFYARWCPGRKAAMTWAIIQLVLFGAAQAGIQPFREIQKEKRSYVETAVQLVPDSALVIPGALSPAFDYYRGIGVKPRWHILWSGWGWDIRKVEAAVRKSWEMRQPVYWCSGPYGWLYLEDEWLDIYYLLKDCPKEQIVPGIVRVYPHP